MSIATGTARQRTRFHYDPTNLQVVRLQTEGLCRQLEELTRRLTQCTLQPEDLEEDFDRLYQPDALALAEAMLHHVPDHDPRIVMVTRFGNLRTFKSDDIETISVPFMSVIASTQLMTIARLLRELARYLPQ